MKRFLPLISLITFFTLAIWISFYNKPEKKIRLYGTNDFSSTAFTTDLYKGSSEFLEFIKNKNQFNLGNCQDVLTQLYTQITSTEASQFDQPIVREQFQQIIKNLFLIRFHLKSRLHDFYNEGLENNMGCLNAARNTNRVARFLEDYLGEMFLNIPAFIEGKHSRYATLNNQDPTTLRGEPPHLFLSPDIDKLNLRSGDIIISRGNAYASAAIARIAEVDSQFSHVAFIYDENGGDGRTYTIDEALKNPNLKVVEAHIEIGSTIRTFSEYAKDGNARNVVFRFHDAKTAHQAGQMIVDHILKIISKRKGNIIQKLHPWVTKEDVNYNVPYDFKMDRNDENELFCSEIASLAYQKVGVKIPIFESQMEQNNDLIKKMEIVEKMTFAPGDLELDPQFRMLAEWRDYRKVKNTRQKDAVLSAMFAWMNEYNYKFHSSLKTDAKSIFGWLIRQSDINLFAVESKVPKNMNVTLMSTIQILDNVGLKLQSYLETREQIFFKKSNRLFTYHESLEILEKYRQVDFAKWKKSNHTNSDFHQQFHP